MKQFMVLIMLVAVFGFAGLALAGWTPTVYTTDNVTESASFNDPSNLLWSSADMANGATIVGYNSSGYGGTANDELFLVDGLNPTYTGGVTNNTFSAPDGGGPSSAIVYFPSGISVSKINVLTGMEGGRGLYHFDVDWSTLASPDPLDAVGTGDWVMGFGATDPDVYPGHALNQVYATPNAGDPIIGATVKAIRLTIYTDLWPGESGMYREFDVYGPSEPPVAEPSALALVGLGLLGITRRRK